MARDIPGTSANYLSVGDVAAIDITGTALTVAAWVRVDALPGVFSGIVSKLNGASDAYELGLGTTKPQFVVADAPGAYDNATFATTLTTGVWHHLAGVKNGTGAGALLGYLDGVQDVSVTSNKSIVNASAPLTLGARSNADLFLDGRLAEVGIWDVALTAAEILALAKGVSPSLIRRQSLKGFWPLFGTAYPEADLSINLNGATQVGTVGAADHSPTGPLVV